MHLFLSRFFLSFALLFLYAPPLSAQITIAIFGDSITFGFGVPTEKAFPAQLELLLREKGVPAKVINAGMNGPSTLSSLARLKWLMRSQPDLVILSLGLDDGLRGKALASIKEPLASMIDYINQYDTKILLAGMKLPFNSSETYRREYEELFKELSLRFKVPLIPFLLEGVAGQRHLNLADGIHPNEEGHRIIAKTIFTYLERIL